MRLTPTWALIDRDDTINVGAPEREYVTDPASVRLLPGAAEAIATLNRFGVPTAVVANQRGVALGLMSECDLEDVNDRVRQLLADEAGARLDHVFTCTHHLDSCACRKPGTGMLEAAERAVGRPLREAVMIGDKETDVEAGRRAGTLVTVRIAPAGTPTDADLLLPSLLDAVQKVFGERGE